MAFAQHSKVVLSGDLERAWFGADAVNVGSATILPGMGVMLKTNVEGGEIYVYATALTVALTDTQIHLSAGVAQERMEPSEKGYVAFGGYLTKVLASGTVAAGDWMCMSGSYAGVFVTANFSFSPSVLMVIADQTHSGVTPATIRGFLLPWRVGY